MTKSNKGLWVTLIGIGILIFIFVVMIPGIHRDPAPAKRVICMANLRQILFSFLMYREDKKMGPDNTKWCDTLKPYYEDAEILQCPADKVGPCSYGMNENIPADANELPDDLVLLFEAAPGWNQVGGPGDVVTDRHHQPGANIAFADGHVEFVDAEDIPNLRWIIDGERGPRQ